MASSSEAVLSGEVFGNEKKALWVFAYGSLCWKPGFKYHKVVTGHVRGFHRRFWQGNTTHRGTEEKPGRVATLVENSQGLVHGLAFAITGEAAIPYLNNRECELGGYTTLFTDFHPVNGDPFKVLIYIATSKNPLWLGDAHPQDIANQVVDCEGPSGHNVEYVLRLANFMKQHFPDHEDPHLFDIEKEVLNLVSEKEMCLLSLMGNGDGCVVFIKEERRRSTDNSDDENRERVETFQHTARISGTKLRCLNI